MTTLPILTPPLHFFRPLLALLPLLLTACRSPDETPPAAQVPVITARQVPPSGPVVEQDEAYASIRIVRSLEGPRSRPEVRLPQGYRLYDQGNYAAASPGEYYTFIGGPAGIAKDVRIRWLGQDIIAVIHDDTRLDFRRDGDSVLVDVPLEAPSLRAAWSTLEVFSFLDEPNLSIRIEHNDVSRQAGQYARIPWVESQKQAALNFIFAARQIFRDWGIHHHIAEEGLGQIALMGFESNNPLHGDFPPHWHLIYYWPDNGNPSHNAPGSQVPHFYIDSTGRIYENKLDVFGSPVLSRRLNPGQPVEYTDLNGKLRFAAEIRTDGGLDLGPAPGQWRYSITPATDGNFIDGVTVLKDNHPWILVGAHDDTASGALTVRVRPLEPEAELITEVYEYDPLTGVIEKATPQPARSSQTLPATSPSSGHRPH